jgi:hypothetical protein
MENNNVKNNTDDMDLVFELGLGKEIIQSIARNDFGIELTDIELNRIKKCGSDGDLFYEAMTNLIDVVISYVLCDGNDPWDELDIDFHATKNAADNQIN